MTTEAAHSRTAKRARPASRAEAQKPDGPSPGPLVHIVVQDLRPSTPHGYPAKAVVGEVVPVRANIFKDGHDVLAAWALLRKSGEVVDACALTHTGNDEWSGRLSPSGIGLHELVVQAWTDRYATWAHRAVVKLAARQDVHNEIAEAVALLSEWRAPAGEGPADGPPEGPVASALAALRDEGIDDAGRINRALSAPVAAALAGEKFATDLTTAPPAPLWVDRPAAAVGAWYELFPRSFGGLRGAAGQVPWLAELGFDILYLPPVHPIGHTFRKGRDNSLTAGPEDPGSPWAIGSEDGGHTAIHPDLGTFDDFDYLVRTAAEHGMEVALDYALNCTPDHPWVREHPEWFHHRPDGSIAYAENPPKKYQDIYPLNFWPGSEAARAALWDACKEIIDFWAERGVRIFRVDNPHTKPFAFWEWLVSALHREHPDIVLLAEAFTRPKVMARLAEVGFSQSYTYFTWRTVQYGLEGLRTYMEELAHGPLADYMRPNFWTNTPDILSGPLRNGPPAAFALRLVLAATLAPSYGIYSGYELCENEPASPDNEEYLAAEKFELRERDLSHAALAPLVKAVNDARRRHPALTSLRSVRFHGSDNPDVMAYSKTSDDSRDLVLVVVTLEPYAVREATLQLDTDALGLGAGPFEVYDELSGESYTWGPSPYVRFDPSNRVAHILAVRKQG
jgi:starch synthase (maltosyl-transferring)